MPSKFDELLTQLGTGRWNMLSFIATGYYYFLLPPHIFSGVYLAPPMNYTCIPPVLYQPVEIASESCSYFVSNSSSDKRDEFPCTEFEYDTSVYGNTLTSEFDLVCGRASFRATFQSIYALATIFSSVASGYIADRFGRKVVVVVTQVAYAALAFSIAFLHNFLIILAFRFLMGCLALATIFMLCMEVCEVKYRSAVGILTGLPFAFGIMGFAGVAYQCRDWRWLQIFITLPFLIFIPALILMDESPRWLIVRGQYDRAIDIIQKAAQWNKTQLPSTDTLRELMFDIQEEANQLEETVKEKGVNRWTVPRIIRTWPIRIIISILSMNLFVSALVFCGLSLSGSNFSADPFLYMVISGLMEVPGYTLTAPLINRFGRRWPTICGFAISGLVILLLVCIPEDMSWLVLTLAMLGKMTNSGTFIIIYMYVSEVLPTEVRLQGLGITTMSCCLGATFAPYVTDYLGPVVPWAPSVIFGVSSLVAAVAMLPMPETLGKPMPDTIHDLAEISFWP